MNYKLSRADAESMDRALSRSIAATQDEPELTAVHANVTRARDILRSGIEPITDQAQGGTR